MPVFRFRVYWEEDDLIYRDIEILTAQSFLDFHKAIYTAFEFDGKHNAFFYESNDRGQRLRALSSEVLSNKRDAPALSMLKTPVAALVSAPDQKFIYVYDPLKNWTFLVELISILEHEESQKAYPFTLRKEGMAPQQYHLGATQNMLLEIENKYDLGADEMSEGYSSDNDSTSEGEESYDSSVEESDF